MNKNLNSFEKRKQNRIRLEIPIRYQKVISDNEFSEEKESLTRDINKNGLLFKAKEIFSLGEKIKISVLLPAIKHPVHILSKIVRVEEIEFKKEYKVGVVFLKFEDPDRKSIAIHIEHMDIMRLLETVYKENASDLHLVYGLPPMLRVYKKIKPIENIEPFTKESLKKMIYSIMSDEQIQIFEEKKEMNFAFSPSPKFRFRVNVHYQRGAVEAAFRSIPSKVNSLQELRLPSVIEDFTNLKSGIVIIAGTTGSGKTTTLSAIIDSINRNREAIIICLEQPIEYVHTNIKSIIKQREVGIDTLSFASGLKNALRQDPDVILVGEMQDIETIQTALVAAETGHLILTSLHAPDSIDAINRIISVFPAGQQEQVCFQLSHCLQGIVTQSLLPAKYKAELILATEVLVMTDAARNLIKTRSFSQLNSIIQTGAQHGMHTMDKSIKELYKEGGINKETVMEYSNEFVE